MTTGQSRCWMAQKSAAKAIRSLETGLLTISGSRSCHLELGVVHKLQYRFIVIRLISCTTAVATFWAAIVLQTFRTSRQVSKSLTFPLVGVCFRMRLLTYGIVRFLEDRSK